MFYQKSRREKNTFMVNTVTFFPRKSCRLWDNVDKYGTVRQATDDNTIRRMRTAYWTTATNTRSEYVILLVFHGNSVYVNVTQCVLCYFVVAFLVSYLLRCLRHVCFPCIIYILCGLFIASFSPLC